MLLLLDVLSSIVLINRYISFFFFNSLQKYKLNYIIQLKIYIYIQYIYTYIYIYVYIYKKAWGAENDRNEIEPEILGEYLKRRKSGIIGWIFPDWSRTTSQNERECKAQIERLLVTTTQLHTDGLCRRYRVQSSSIHDENQRRDAIFFLSDIYPSIWIRRWTRGREDTYIRIYTRIYKSLDKGHPLKTDNMKSDERNSTSSLQKVSVSPSLATSR